MRKVKVLAFVLAALMVVAAFAGCGTKQLKTDVSTLDERVTALETLLKQVSETVNGGATKDDITEILDAITANKAEAAAGDKTLADAIAKITADQATANAALKADLEKLVDAAKKDQAAGDTALQVAIEKLNNSIDATNKALADAIKDLEGDIAAGDKATLDAVKELLNEQNKDIADALEDLKESIEKNKEEAGANVSLQAAISEYVSNLTVAKTGYDVDQIHYTDSDYAAVTKAISTGIASVQAATTVDAAKAAYDATVAELAKYERVDVALYAAYTALRNHVTADSWDDIEAYEVAAKAAKKHYKAKERLDVVAEYEYKANTYYDLVETEVNNLKDAYRYLVKTLIPRIEELVDDIDAIERVQYIETTDADGDPVVVNISKVTAANKEYTNSSAPYGIKEIIKNTDSTKTDVRKNGAYIDDSVLDLVSNYKALTDHIATVNSLTKAAAVFGTYADTDNKGNYQNVFAKYISMDTDPAAPYKRNWFEAESAFNTVNGKINAWLEDYPLVDELNAKAIIDKYLSDKASGFDYDTYLADEVVMKLFAEKFDYFCDEFVPRIKAVGKFSEISTENIQTYVELYKEIEDWKIVIEDDDDDGEHELVIDDDQYSRMCKKSALDRTYDFKYDNATVGAFFNGEVKTAQGVAKLINEKIDALEASASSALSLAAFKRLEGYIWDQYVTDKGDIYVVDTNDYTVDQVVAAGTNVTIAQFAAAFVGGDEYYSYDLTYLLDLDDLAAAEKVVEERIATYEALTKKISSALAAIKNDLATANKVKLEDLNATQYQALLNTVNLDNKAAVEALRADYTALVAKGYRPETTRNWVPVKDAAGKVVEGEFMDARLLPADVVYEITGFANIVEELNGMANNIVKFMGQVASANKYKAFTVKDADEHIAVTNFKKTSVTYTEANTGKDKTETTRKWTYLKNTPVIGLRSFNIDSNTTDWTSNLGNDNQPKKSNISGGLTQVEAVELAWNAYYNFLEDNQGNEYAAVEAALATNDMEGLRFIALKALAYNAVKNVDSTKAVDWKPEFGDYQVQEDIQLKAIEAAVSLEVVADILHGFYEMTGSAYDAIDFAGVHYFHTDGTLHVESEKYPCEHADHNTVNA